MEQIKIIINNKEYSYKKNITLLDVSKDFSSEFKYPIIAAYIDNKLEDLTIKINHDCKVRFIDALDRVGNKIYQKTLSFILIYAMYLLYGKEGKIKISHSIDKAILIESSKIIEESEIEKIKQKIQELINDKIPIGKTYVNRIDAINYFTNLDNDIKADTLKYNTSKFISLYKMGKIYNYFYTVMGHNTSCITDFDLTYINDHKFVLQFPVSFLEGKVPSYNKENKLIDTFSEHDSYLKRVNVYSSADINDLVSKRKIEGIIKLDEVIANQKLLEIATEIADKKDKIKLVLIAGPSSSGKTTTSKKLSMFLRNFGMNPRALSIDDYFKDRVDTPKDENGKYDFESIDAVKVELFNSDLDKILKGEEVEVPTFNFITGEGEYKGNVIKLEENDILIVEGLHAINNVLTKDIENDRKYKLYVAELTNLNIDNENIVSTSDVRLLRRIIRDARTRGYSAEETIASWNKVREGEEKYIFPFQNEVDKVYNTALIYEIGVLRLYAEPLLYDIDKNSQYYEEAKRLLNFLRMFLTVPGDMVPTDSILREFIGGSFFE